MASTAVTWGTVQFTQIESGKSGTAARATAPLRRVAPMTRGSHRCRGDEGLGDFHSKRSTQALSAGGMPPCVKQDTTPDLIEILQKIRTGQIQSFLKHGAATVKPLDRWTAPHRAATLKERMRGAASHKAIRSQISGQISGQISIVAATLMATTFFLFFAFVVNTGMLVHAKINLQNAADMAAYAGAATQARQLEKIGILNYEMRRQYKRFLFRYYVYGNFYRPDPPGGGGTKQFGAFKRGTRTFQDLGVPAVCLIFKDNDNPCRIYDLQPVTIQNSPSFLDAIGQALKESLYKLEEIRKRNCSSLSAANILALYLWLYNTDPEGSGGLLDSLYNDDETRLALSTLPAITRGLGLVPRNLLLNQRIQTLAEFVNQAPRRRLTMDAITPLESSNTPMLHERTIQAFKSAHRTLGEALFDNDSVQMDELLPEGDQGLLSLETLEATFMTYATFIAEESQGSGDCRQRLFGVPVKALPVGVSKKQDSSPVYYAVRLRGTPKLLFNPFGDLALEAYAAAKPFGSRLGPTSTSSTAAEFVIPDKKPNPFAMAGYAGPIGQGLPTMKFSPTNANGLFDFQLYNQLAGYLRAAGPGALTPDKLIEAEGVTALPNQAEYGRYIIPTDDLGPQSAERFKEYFGTGSGNFYSFYAPLSVGPGGDGGQSVIAGMLQASLSGEDAGGVTGIANLLKRNLRLYFSKLQQGQGEAGEGLNVVRIMDPMRDVQGNDVSNRIPGFPRLPESALRPWYSGENHAPNRSDGRVGYSVKLVSFQSLFNGGTPLRSGVPELDDLRSVIEH